MPNPENDPCPAEGRADSLNSEIVEVTGGTVDTTVRPMRESLRKRLKPPYNCQPLPPALPPQEPPQEQPPS